MCFPARVTNATRLGPATERPLARDVSDERRLRRVSAARPIPHRRSRDRPRRVSTGHWALELKAQDLSRARGYYGNTSPRGRSGISCSRVLFLNPFMFIYKFCFYSLLIGGYTGPGITVQWNTASEASRVSMLATDFTISVSHLLSHCLCLSLGPFVF